MALLILTEEKKEKNLTTEHTETRKGKIKEKDKNNDKLIGFYEAQRSKILVQRRVILLGL